MPTITSTFTLQNDTVTVLLIDDQAIVGETVRQILTHEKDILFHYISAPTQAIQKAVEITPTVILLDLVIPGIDGLMLLRWFRFYEATRDIPIVILSGKEEPELKAEAFAQGANDYLIKLP
ncbi:response regulator [Scytonema sp. NUACC26]|uniref:response regulator n=1 Tax=Scytonema sp. NUACC26 TaxID=3140176 RepID=UPI0038B3776E